MTKCNNLESVPSVFSHVQLEPTRLHLNHPDQKAFDSYLEYVLFPTPIANNIYAAKNIIIAKCCLAIENPFYPETV